jgi:hypothetical protein
MKMKKVIGMVLSFSARSLLVLGLATLAVRNAVVYREGHDETILTINVVP